MPLPQKVVDQLAREPARTPGWAGRLLMFSSTVFFISAGIYVGLAFGFEPYLQGQIDELDSRKQGFGQQFTAEQQTQIIELHSQITNIKGLLDAHIAPTTFFTWLEEHTHQGIAFSKMVFDAEAYEVALEGTASNVNIFVEQIGEFQRQSGVAQVVFGNVNAESNGTWEFNVIITFDPSFFLQAEVFARNAAPLSDVVETDGNETETGVETEGFLQF